MRRTVSAAVRRDHQVEVVSVLEAMGPLCGRVSFGVAGFSDDAGDGVWCAVVRVAAFGADEVADLDDIDADHELVGDLSQRLAEGAAGAVFLLAGAVPTGLVEAL